MNQNIRLYNPTLEKTNWGYIIGYLIIFLFLPPFIGLPLVIGSIWKKRNAPRTDYYTFFLCIAAYFAAINATKAPSGDQVNYYLAYQNVPQIGFWKSLIYIYGSQLENASLSDTISGEFMNGVYNYIGYYLTFGYYPLFAAIYSFVEIMLIMMGLYHFSTRLKNPHIPLICGCLTLCFFYLYFNLMLHIQKQFMGQAIMMYVLGNYARYGKMSKKLYILAACSIFTHASNILFIPFLFIKRLRSNLSFSSMMMLCIIFFLMIVFAPQIVGSMDVDSGNALSYSLSRVADSEGQMDLVGQMSFTHPRTLTTLLPLLYVLFKKLWLERRTLNATEMFILNIQLLLILAVFAMFNQPLAQYRYYMMVYMFIPFFLPYIANNIKRRNQILISFAILSVSTFYIFFENIKWDYAPEWQIISFPPLALISIGY